MNTLLVFFAIPVATIILSAIFETIMNNPIKVAGIFFSIYIVPACALGGTAELILAAIIYTIISFIIAGIVYIYNNYHYCRNIREITPENLEITSCLESEADVKCSRRYK